MPARYGRLGNCGGIFAILKTCRTSISTRETLSGKRTVVLLTTTDNSLDFLLTPRLLRCVCRGVEDDSLVDRELERSQNNTRASRRNDINGKDGWDQTIDTPNVSRNKTREHTGADQASAFY